MTRTDKEISDDALATAYEKAGFSEDEVLEAKNMGFNSAAFLDKTHSHGIALKGKDRADFAENLLKQAELDAQGRNVQSEDNSPDGINNKLERLMKHPIANRKEINELMALGRATGQFK